MTWSSDKFMLCLEQRIQLQRRRRADRYRSGDVLQHRFRLRRFPELSYVGTTQRRTQWMPWYCLDWSNAFANTEDWKSDSFASSLRRFAMATALLDLLTFVLPRADSPGSPDLRFSTVREGAHVVMLLVRACLRRRIKELRKWKPSISTSQDQNSHRERLVFSRVGLQGLPTDLHSRYFKKAALDQFHTGTA